MSSAAWLQIVALVALVVAGTRLLGPYLARVYGDGPAPGDRFFAPVERLLYRLGGIDPRREQPWTLYALSLLAFSAVSVIGLYLLQRVQGALPLNPTDVGAVPPALAFNTAVSFVTNTNWQNYGGESTMSHLTQMAGLTVQNFVSAAVGIAVAVALDSRPGPPAQRHDRELLGRPRANDDPRAAAAVASSVALLLASQGVVQTLRGPGRRRPSRVRRSRSTAGPIASQEAIKELGTNGGGIVNANSAHPFENPTGFTNLVEMLALLLIPFALTYAFGRMVGNQRQGWAVFAAMFVLWLGSPPRSRRTSRSHGNPRVDAARREHGGQGGALRRAASGAVRRLHHGDLDGRGRLRPRQLHARGGAVPLVNMMLGEVSPGGVGAGLYGMLVFVLLAVFIAGLMVGRTPEFLGKKIQAAEMKLVVLYLLAAPLLVLGFSGLSLVLETGKASILNPGPHGLTEVLYAFTSASQQQRLRLRRAQREHRLVQHDTRPGDARRPLPPDRAAPRDRRVAGAQAARPADRRHVPDGVTPLFVALLVGGRADRRRPDLLPRLSPSGRSWSSSDCDARLDLGSRARDPATGGRRQPPQARPSTNGPEPGDVHRRGRQRRRDRCSRSRTRACSPG